MIAGEAEAACCRIGMAGFSAAKALSTNFNNTPQRLQGLGTVIEMVLLWERDQAY